MAAKPVRKIQILLVGKSYSGKTAIIQRYLKDEFLEEYNSTSEPVFQLKKTDGGAISVLWDVKGMGNDRSMTRSVITRKQVILIVYDTNDQESTEDLGYMLQDVDCKRDDNSIIGLVGNKIDLQRMTNRKETEDFAKKNDILYYEVSAKSGENVNKMFNEVIEKSLCSLKEKDKKKDMVTTQSGCNCSIS